MACATASGVSPNSDPSDLSSYWPSEDKGAFLANWISRGFTHGFDLLVPPGVVGREPNPGPGNARLVDEVFAKFIRRLISEAVGCRLEKLVFLLRPLLERSTMLDAAAGLFLL
jgi:hypothetical protein